jgi:glycerol-3-phosphate responsive antiterminator
MEDRRLACLGERASCPFFQTQQAGSLLAETAKMAILQAQNSLLRCIHRLFIPDEQMFFSYHHPHRFARLRCDGAILLRR